MHRLNVLRSPVFLISIGILSLNDFVLKTTFHNWLTGKLSDFAGLIALTLFGCAMRPNARWRIGVVVAALFSFWKSPYSQGLIQFANDYLPFQIGRTVDYTDMIALPAVWWACYYAPTFRSLEMRQICVFGIAGLSLVAFTGTTIIDSHVVRESAVVLQRPVQAANASVENELQRMLDGIAEKRSMRCIICDPLSKGRVYAVNGENSQQLALTASLDPRHSSLLYDVRTTSLGGQLRIKEVDELRTEVHEMLRTNFPSVEITSAAYPSSEQICLGVWKKERFTSYRERSNQDDYVTARTIVAELAMGAGMHQVSESMFGAGRLFGPNPYDRDFVVSTGIADSPLVVISIYCHSSECMEPQRRLANELEQKLRETFGNDRASIR